MLQATRDKTKHHRTNALHIRPLQDVVPPQSLTRFSVLPRIGTTSNNAVDFGYFIGVEAITLTPIEGCLSPHSLIDYYRALEVDLRSAIANCGKRDIYCFQLDFAITPNRHRTLYGTLRGVDDEDFALLLLKRFEKTPFPEVYSIFIGSVLAYSASDFGEFGFMPPFSLGFAELPPTVTEALELIAKRNIAHRRIRDKLFGHFVCR